MKLFKQTLRSSDFPLKVLWDFHLAVNFHPSYSEYPNQRVSQAVWEDLGVIHSGAFDSLDAMDDDLDDADLLEATEIKSEENSSSHLVVDLHVNHKSLVASGQTIYFRDRIVCSAKLKGESFDSLVLAFKDGTLVIAQPSLNEDVLQLSVVEKLQLSKQIYDVSAHGNGLLFACQFDQFIRWFKLNDERKIVESSTSSLSDCIVLDCFLANRELPDHSLYCALAFDVNHQKLSLLLYEYYMDTSLTEMIVHSNYLLPNTFPIPRFMIGLEKCSAILFVCEKTIILKTANAILAQEDIYDPGSSFGIPLVDDSINTYYHPPHILEQWLPEEENVLDQVVLSTLNRSIWVLNIVKSHQKFEVIPKKVGTLFTEIEFFKLDVNCSLIVNNTRSELHLEVKESFNGAAKSTKKQTRAQSFPVVDCHLVPVRDSLSRSSHECWTLSPHSAAVHHVGYIAERVSMDGTFSGACNLFYIDRRYVVLSFVTYSEVWSINEPPHFTGIRLPGCGVGAMPLTENKVLYACEDRLHMFDVCSKATKSLQLKYRLVDCSYACDIGALLFDLDGESQLSLIDPDLNSIAFPFSIDRQLSCARIVEGHDTQLFLCSFSNEVEIFNIRNGHFQRSHTFTVPEVFGGVHDVKFWKATGRYILTSKNGHYIHCGRHFDIIKTMRLDCVKLDIVSDKQHMFLRGSHLWKLDSQSIYADAVYLDETITRSIQTAVVIPEAETSVTKFLVSRRGTLYLVLARHVKDRICNRVKFPITARKFTYYSHYNLLVAVGEGKQQKMAFIDVATRSLLDHVSEPQSLFSEDETPVCVKEWCVVSGTQRRHLQVLIGCKRGDSEGSVYIMRFEKLKSLEKPLIAVTVLHSWRCDKPIEFFAQTSDSSIVYSQGKNVVQTQYNADLKKMNVPLVLYQCPEKIVKLLVGQNDCIVVALQNGTLIVLIKKGEWQSSYIATGMRIHDVILSGKLIIVSDKLSCTLRGILFQDGIFSTAFSTEADVIPRLANFGCDPPWTEGIPKFATFAVNGEICQYIEDKGEKNSIEGEQEMTEEIISLDKTFDLGQSSFIGLDDSTDFDLLRHSSLI